MLRFFLCIGLFGCGSVKKGADGGPDGDGAPPGFQRLSVTVTGEGQVTSDPPGIECPETCTADFDEGVEVTLTAVPSAASDLREWIGDCTGFGPCAVTMDASRAVDATFGPHGSKRWVGQISFSGSDMTQGDAVVDGEGNPIIAGTIDAGASRNLYVAKFDKVTGDLVWDTLIETPMASEDFGGLAVDAEGNAYAGAKIIGDEQPVTIGGTEVTPDIPGNIFVVRLAAATGDFEWVVQWGGGGQEVLSGFAVLGDHLYAVGETGSDPCDFNGAEVTAADAFLVKVRLDNGNGVLAKPLVGNIHPQAVASGNSRIGVTGWFLGTPTIDAGCGINSSGANSDDGFVAQFLPADLDCQWANDFGDFDDDQGVDSPGIAAYPGGGWVATGSFEGAVLFADSGTSLQSRGLSDVYAVRYAGNGDHVWSFRYGDTGDDGGAAVTTGSDGATFLTGHFESDITFGGFDLTGAENAYLTRMSPGNAPAHEWAVSLGGDASDQPEGIAIDASGYVYLLASFMGMTDVDGEVLTSMATDGWLGALVR